MRRIGGKALRAWLALVFSLLAFGPLVASAQEDSMEAGASLFAENCAMCHGATGEGRVGATLAKNWPSIRPDLTVRTVIENGVPGTAMPAWGQARGGPLSEAQIDALVDYILSWQTGGAPQITPAATATRRLPITPPAEAAGDPNRGALLFDENCVVCHGLEGEGRVGATLAKSWASIWPEQVIRTSIENGVPGSVMPAWSQANGGPLSAGDIDDLTAYVLTLAEGGNVAQVSPTVVAPEVPASPWLRGWGGVVVFVVLLVVVFGGIIVLQRRR